MSLAGRLLTFLLLPTVLVIIACGLWSFQVAKNSVNNLHDKSLADGSELLISFLLYEFRESEDDEDDDDDDEDGRGNSQEDLAEELLEVIEILQTQYNLQSNYRVTVKNKVLFSTADIRALAGCSPGYSNLKTPGNGVNALTKSGAVQQREEWRCYQRSESVNTSADMIVVEVFGLLSEREKEIAGILMATFLPLIFLPLVVCGVVLWAVRDSISRIKKLSNSVEHRSMDKLDAIDSTGQPKEFVPIVLSVNSFIKKIRDGIEREKRFTDDAAHELRTPITSISMLEQLLRRENKDKNIEGLIDQLKSATGQCHQLIDQLLLFARLQSSDSLSRQTLSLSSLLHTETGKLSAMINEKSLSFEIDPALDASTLEANPEAMSLLLHNLLANAVKFSPPYGVITILHTATGIRIEDDGPGIPPEYRERIFDRFFRAPTAKFAEGSGLGLSIANWLAKSQQFDVYATDPLKGRGASIALDFNNRL